MYSPAAPSARFQPFEARVVLLVFALTLILFVGITLSPLQSGFADKPSRGPGDIALYRAEIERMRQGQGYYDAAAAELRERGYPTRSVFNWRMPLPMALIARVPTIDFAKALLGGLCCLLLLASLKLLTDEGNSREALCGLLLLSGALLPCVLGHLAVMSELWAGVLMALSVVLFGIGRRTAGIAAALAALFFRELAAPFCLVCIGMTVYEQRYRELALWAAGLAAYAVFLAFHLSEVVPRIMPDARAHEQGWVRWGGAAFLIATTQMNAYLLILPQWVTAIYLACVLLGCATWNTPAGRLIACSVAAYGIGFSLVGHDFNQYWGSLTAPLFALAAGRAPGTLLALARAACPAAGLRSIAVEC